MSLTREQLEAHLRMLETLPKRVHHGVTHEGTQGVKLHGVLPAVLVTNCRELMRRPHTKMSLMLQLHCGRITLLRVLKRIAEEDARRDSDT